MSRSSRSSNGGAIGVKELRENLAYYIKKVDDGETFTVYKRTKPVFKLEPVDSGDWEEVINFTKLKKGGVDIDELLEHL